MSEHDDKQHDNDIARLRERYSSLSAEEPGPAIDAFIHAAAEREVRRPYRPAWGAAAGLAACIGLAVVIVPTLLIKAPHEATPTATDLVLVAERQVDEVAVRQKQRESMAMRAAPAAPPPMPDAVEGKGGVSLAHEEWLAREEIAPAKPTAPAAAESRSRKLMLPESADTTADAGSADSVAARRAAIRTELAEADEATWRARLLALRAQGDEVLAHELLEDYRDRFGQPDEFTLDDLKRMNEERKNNE